jgi:N-formylglutamate amidohydrolase
MSELSFDLYRGHLPLLVSMPHMGSFIPSSLAGSLLPRALDSEDADWHMDRLYDFVLDMGASVLRPRMSRYVIDLNRPPDDAPMYPGASNTELCPTRFFTRSAKSPPARTSWRGAKPTGSRITTRSIRNCNACSGCMAECCFGTHTASDLSYRGCLKVACPT